MIDSKEEAAICDKAARELLASEKALQVNHTQGEWFARREGSSTVYIECRIGAGMLQEVAACGPTANGSDEQEANARLIAAAPELLEALQMSINAFDGDAINEIELSYGLGTALRVNTARFVIAKATGEQS